MPNVRQTRPDDGLKVWEKVRIIAGEGSDAGVFEARVEDFVDGGIVVTHPELISGSVLLRQDLTVRVQITREDAAYQFTSVIRAFGSQTLGRRVVLTPPVRMQRIQRRQFARIDISSQVDYARFRSVTDWQDWRNSLNWQRTRSLDISGGGVLLKLSEEIAAESLLILKIDFMPGIGLPEAIVGICCRECVQGADRCCGVKFLLKSDLSRYVDNKVHARLPQELKEFDAHIQDRLVMHIFHKQIELRQKGLI